MHVEEFVLENGVKHKLVWETPDPACYRIMHYVFDKNGNTVNHSIFTFHDSDEADEKANQIMEAYELESLTNMYDE